MSVKIAWRTLEILELFAEEKRPLMLSEIARLLDMPVSTCLGLLRTLEGRGYLYETGRRQGYYPTSRLLALAQVISAHDPVIERVRPTLAELRDATRETVVFGKLRDPQHVVYLEVLDAPQSIRYVAAVGDTRASYANSLGRALLSTLTPEERYAVLSEGSLARLTDATLITADAIESDIADSATRGCYVNLGESIPDLIGIAWPLRLGRDAYAVSVVGPRYRLESAMESVAAMLRSACISLESKG